MQSQRDPRVPVAMHDQLLVLIEHLLLRRFKVVQERLAEDVNVSMGLTLHCVGPKVGDEPETTFHMLRSLLVGNATYSPNI
jgi:hypothetical protein